MSCLIISLSRFVLVVSSTGSTQCLFALPENLLIELPVTMEFKNIPTITCFLFVISIVAFYFPIPEFFPNGASVCPLSVTPKVCGQFPRYLGT